MRNYTLKINIIRLNHTYEDKIANDEIQIQIFTFKVL